MTAKQGPFSHLRPTTTPEMLDRAYAATFRFAPLLWGASFVFAADHLLPLVFGHIPESKSATPAIAGLLLGLMLLGEYSSALGYLSLFQGMLFPLRPLSAKALTRTGLRKLPAYFLTHLLYLVSTSMVIITAYGFFSARDEMGSAVLRIATGIIASVGGLWLIIRLCLGPVVSLIEDCGPFKAFARSWHLTSIRFGVNGSRPDVPALRWLAALALPASLSLAFAAGVGLYAWHGLGARLPIDWSDDAVSWSLNLYLFLTMFLAAPLYWAGLMALYVEYRMRHEALDFYLRLRERRREMSAPDNLTAAKSH